jgi:hypothetical protein
MMLTRKCRAASSNSAFAVAGFGVSERVEYIITTPRIEDSLQLAAGRFNLNRQEPDLLQILHAGKQKQSRLFKRRLSRILSNGSYDVIHQQTAKNLRLLPIPAR